MSKKRLCSIASKIRNERAMTLVELLASTFIFLLIVIPLSTIYVNGVKLYNETSEKTALRNEANFAISEIMRAMQEASYFEAIDDNPAETEALYNLFTDSDTGPLIRKDDEPLSQFRHVLVTYKHALGYIDGQTQSITLRNEYRFSPAANPKQSDRFFSYSQAYYVNGLFRVSADQKRATVYLLVTPSQGTGQENLQRVKAMLDKGETDMIHFLKTEIDVSTIRNG
jgi:hypothetical protein